MRVIADARTTTERFPRVVITIGCFDGVHLGHQQILKALLDEARAIDGTPAVMTLEPHPRQYFSPENAPNILTGNPIKHRLLEENGVEVLYTLPFDHETATMSPSRFIESVLIGRCNATKVIVGHDFAFGHRAAGDYEYLAASAGQFGFEARQIPPLIIGGQRVSSTLIRERVIQGEVENLKQFLGRAFSLHGNVVPGRGIGKILGFPTANLDVGDCVIPAHGVYAAKAVVRGVSYVAAVNIGIAPTIRNAHPLVEAHLLDFDETAISEAPTGKITNSMDGTGRKPASQGIMGQGEDMEIIFYKRLRPEKKFASREELTAAIAADVQFIRNFFAAKH